jgi:hypothetical protein
LPTPRITPANPWVADGAHQPDPFSPQYIVTGDHFYLEEMQLWAAAQALTYAPGNYGRGASGYAGIQDQIRGNAWVIRSRANAAFLSPDGSPEKTYFNELVEDAFALWEGQRNIQGTPLATHPNWVYGHDKIPIDPSPLHFFTPGLDVNPKDPNGLDPATTSKMDSLWMEYYFLIELGVTRDRGFAAGPTLKWLAALLNGQFADPAYDPVQVGLYRTPVMDAAGHYFPTWAAVAKAVPAATYDAQKAQWAHPPNYYPLLAASAVSATYWEPDGDVAWTFLNTNVRATSQTNFSDEWYAWDLIPRAQGVAPLPPPSP